MTELRDPVDRVTVSLTVNGESHSVEVESRLLLADLIRDHLGLTGTHVGCEHGACGACTVLIDGAAARSCITLAAQADGTEITTVEGLTPAPGLSPLQEAFNTHHGLQCGFCTPGFITTITAADPDEFPDDAGIREMLSGNLCRCTGYEGIVAAVNDFWGRTP